MSERSPRQYQEQPKTPDFSRYTEILTTLADKVQRELNRRGENELEIPLGSEAQLNGIRGRLNKGLGGIMLHPHESEKLDYDFTENTRATSISLSAQTSSWERDIVKPDGKPSEVRHLPGWNTEVGISIKYVDIDEEGNVHRALQSVRMSTDSKKHEGQLMLQRSTTERKSHGIDPMYGPISAEEEQAECFIKIVQELHQIYEVDRRKKEGDPYDQYDWFSDAD